MNTSERERFAHGAKWVRADFHLHTDADKEFKVSAKASYLPDYTQKLKDEEIAVGVITNHNKFAHKEFLKLRERAKAHTLLLPGVELSTNEGANGIHVLIVFGDDWIKNGQDRISPFIASMFPGKAEAEYQNENGRSDSDLQRTLSALEGCKLPYFLIFAHVEQRSGLWTELKGGKLGDLKEKRFRTLRDKTLGFQKVRTHDAVAAGRTGDLGRVQVQRHLGNWYPAELEGSDCKNISEIGKGLSCYIKIGELNYAAVEFALRDHVQRVALKEKPQVVDSPRIQQLSFEGGRFDGETYELSNQLTCLIGSRGSGKSSIIECLRYALDLDAGSDDLKYKNKLVEAILSKGAEITVSGLTADGSRFRIVRSIGYDPRIFVNERETKLHIEDVLPGLLYFGQKDLGNRHENFEIEFFEKLIGGRTAAERIREEELKKALKASVENWNNVLTAQSLEGTYRDEASRLQDQLAIYREHGVEKQLEKLTQFDSDKQNIETLIRTTKEYLFNTEEYNDQGQPVIAAFPTLKSASLEPLAERLSKLKESFTAEFVYLGETLDRLKELFETLEKLHPATREIETQLQSEFAKLQREIKAPAGLDLKTFRSQRARLEQLEKLLKASKNTKSSADDAILTVERHATALHDFWRSEHRAEQKAITDKAENLPKDLKLVLNYEGDRDGLLAFISTLVSGQGVRKARLEKLVDNYRNGLQLFQNRSQIWQDLEGSADLERIRKAVRQNLYPLLSFKVPDERAIRFQDRSIDELSLGQRATALLRLLMSIQGHPIFLIDQPEDDLDNETIFRHVVEPLLENKRRSQFLIATHNPNIPVLGDAELVHASTISDDGRFENSSGSLDTESTRQSIVSIMEGGKEAFEKRQQVYNQWTNTH